MGFRTNIKSLPEDRTYFTEIGYSQSYPWVEVRRTAKTVTVAHVAVNSDPEWMAKKEMVPSGFCAHCPNQSEQTWLFDEIDESLTRTLRMSKKGDWVHKGVTYVENRATYFYDYNF